MPTEQSRKTLEQLLEKLHKRTSRNQRSVVRKAYHLAADAHKFQKRLSGEPYIIHPLEVAIVLAELELDHEAVCAALLHDVLEDTNISYSYMKEEFGETITHLVDGVTKISVLKTQSAESQQATNIRKMILATVKDTRVILIKLADKLHNMRTLKFHKAAKQRRIAQEVIDIYAPLAGRLGIYRIKWELEDLALYYLENDAYKDIKASVAEKRGTRDERIKVNAAILQQHLKENKVKATVEGRSKHFYSIYRKMRITGKSFQEIQDLTGLRVLVKDKQDCYGAIGIVHTLWTPVPGRFKDYISVPKSNGYQSLHTTVVGNDGSLIEIQIRTHQMHHVAEFGIAAHWAYKEKSNPLSAKEQLDILHHLANLEEAGEDATAFMEELKVNLADKEVYVFTPKGDIITLSQGATILDFAFRIHTELGLKCAGARIHDRLVSIRTPVKSGDQIQIITNPTIKPSLNWLKILTTPHARSKLRAWFRKQEGIDTPPETKPRDRKDTDTAESTIPTREIPSKDEGKDEQAKSRIHPRLLKSRGNIHPTIEWEGETNLDTKFARCCAPLPGDAIMGFITRGAGISVHKEGCPSLKALSSNPNNEGRIIELRWSGIYDAFTVHLTITGRDRPQLYLDLVKALAAAGANIIEATASTSPDGKIHNTFMVEVDSLHHMEETLQELRTVAGVISADRIVAPRKGAATKN